MKDDKIQRMAKEVLSGFLKRHGMRQTPERLALLEKVFSSAEHFYIDMLTESLELEGYRISRSTAYATINLFLEAGLVKRHQFPGQPAQYERVIPGGDGKGHLHLVCNICGKVREVKASAIENKLLRQDFAGFSAESATIYVYGVCGRCKRMNNK